MGLTRIFHIKGMAFFLNLLSTLSPALYGILRSGITSVFCLHHSSSLFFEVSLLHQIYNFTNNTPLDFSYKSNNTVFKITRQGRLLLEQGYINVFMTEGNTFESEFNNLIQQNYLYNVMYINL